MGRWGDGAMRRGGEGGIQTSSSGVCHVMFYTTRVVPPLSPGTISRHYLQVLSPGTIYRQTALPNC